MSHLHLLVPLNIAALVIPAKGITDAKWVDLKPEFRGLDPQASRRTFLGKDMGRDNIGTNVRSSLHETGIHLHWALPDGLTHGVARNDSRRPEFPAIPNRWLIMRFWDHGGTPEKLGLRYRAWIVESDTITNDAGAAVWPTLKSGKLAQKKDYYVFVGKRYELSQWPGETTPAASKVDITALGYGNPAFAAYYPACKGILGFHDKDLPDLPQNAALAYVVVGWYSDPSQDPLQQALADKTAGDLSAKFAGLEEFLGKTRWIYPEFVDDLTKIKKMADLEVELKEAVGMLRKFQDAQPKEGAIDNSSAIAELQNRIAALKQEMQRCGTANAALQNALPAYILCHGIITGIQWKGTQDSGVPSRNTQHRIAVGNTAVEALAALFEKTCGERAAKLLSVFQYDLLSDLEKPGGNATVDYQIHERSYGRLARGIRWDLLPETRPTFSGSLNHHVVPMEDRAPPIPGDIRLRLERLNNAQRRINQLRRQQDSLRSELYATWYKKAVNSTARKVQEESLTQRIAELQQEVGRLANAIAALEEENEKRPKVTEWEEIQRQLKTFLPGWKLQQFDEPEFWRPNDPVVLMAGKAFQRSRRHGEDGRYRADGRLLCRLSGQEITGIKVKIPYAINQQDVEFGPADIDNWGDPVAALGGRPVPTEVPSLLREALLLTLDTKRAMAIVTAAYEKNQPGLAAKHGAETKTGADWLLDTYCKKVWEAAEDPDVEHPRLRYPETDKVDQWNFELIGTFPSPVAMSRWGHRDPDDPNKWIEKNPWLPLFLQWEVSWQPAYDNTSHALDNWELAGQGTAFTWTGKNSARQGPVTYSGTTLLTPSATLQFSDRLRQYNLTHDDAKLRTFETAVRAMSVLCQSLGGFTEQLLMRKGFLELRPLEPGSGSEGLQFSPIYDAVQDIDWLAPLTDGKFLPVRSGQLTLNRLWIIDAFGQRLQLEDLKPEEKKGEGTLFNPALPLRLRGGDGSVRFEPRLAQPARLSLQWLPAGQAGPIPRDDVSLRDDEEFDPVCGWILPNYLDEGLMIYDARGYALGFLQRVLRKSWRNGLGGSHPELESFHWVDIPGSKNFYFGISPLRITDPLGETANPHLRAFVNGLLPLTEGRGQAFSDLLDKLNEAFVGGAGSSHDPNLALLIGRPLALVRAALRLEVDGRLACAQGWDDLQQAQTGGVEQLGVRVRLGDRRKWQDTWLGDDGLVGFFLNQDYTRFYPAFGLRGRLDDTYNKYSWAADDTAFLGNLPQLSIGQPLDLTLLLDPSRGVCVTSGILPRTIFHLPYGDLSETLENKQVVFFTGPVVSPESERDIRMPEPSDIYGQWSWTHHPEIKVWKQESIVDVQKEQGRFSETPLQIAEGWLKLTTAPLVIRVFTVKGKNPVAQENEPERDEKPAKPERFVVTASETITLTWSVSGAEQIALGAEPPAESPPLFTSHRHPLPTQYAVQVNQTMSFTLLASDREGKTVSRKILLQIT
jgi:uncharacterized small protein (DUF1192 family)